MTRRLRVAASGLLLLLTPHAEAERLAVSDADKNASCFEEMIGLEVAQSLKLQSLSLVAGVVTGGGGKATTTKTKRHRAPFGERARRS